MCLIITAFAAAVTTLIWFLALRDNRYMLGRLALMYWGAAIMWSVDGIFSVAEGEGFFNLSLDDTFLGIVVVSCGIIAWVIMLAAREIKHMVAAN